MIGPALGFPSNFSVFFGCQVHFGIHGFGHVPSLSSSRQLLGQLITRKIEGILMNCVASGIFIPLQWDTMGMDFYIILSRWYGHFTVSNVAKHFNLNGCQYIVDFLTYIFWPKDGKQKDQYAKTVPGKVVFSTV